jgi:hypothetical protein
VTGCPQKEFIDTSIVELIRYSDLFFKGIPPVAGAALDQDQHFLESATFLKREQERLEHDELMPLLRRIADKK